MIHSRWIAALALGIGLTLLPGTRATAQDEKDTPKPAAGRRDDGPPRPGQPRERPDGERPDARSEGPRKPPGGPGGGGPGGPGRPERGPEGPGRGERSPPGGPRPGFSGRPGGPGGHGGPGFGPPMDWEHLKKVDPEMYKLELADDEMERQTSELSMQFRRAPKDQKPELRKQLEETVVRHFEVRQEKRQLQLTRLEKELQRMREEIERRSEKRAEIVGKRIAELVGERSDIDF